MKKNDFKWDTPKPIRKDIQDNDVVLVYIPVKMHFKYSDKIVDDIDEEGNALSFKEGFLMNIAEPLKPNQVYQGQGAQFQYSVIENKEFDELSNTFVSTASNTAVLSPDNVCPACEYGKCEYCGKVGPIVRKYWYYPIKCSCCSPQHFEYVCHCADCVPVEPTETKIHIIRNGLDCSQMFPTSMFIKPNKEMETVHFNACVNTIDECIKEWKVDMTDKICPPHPPIDNKIKQ